MERVNSWDIWDDLWSDWEQQKCCVCGQLARVECCGRCCGSGLYVNHATGVETRCGACGGSGVWVCCTEVASAQHQSFFQAQEQKGCKRDDDHDYLELGRDRIALQTWKSLRKRFLPWGKPLYPDSLDDGPSSEELSRLLGL